MLSSPSNSIQRTLRKLELSRRALSTWVGSEESRNRILVLMSDMVFILLEEGLLLGQVFTLRKVPGLLLSSINQLRVLYLAGTLKHIRVLTSDRINTINIYLENLKILKEWGLLMRGKHIQLPREESFLIRNILVRIILHKPILVKLPRRGLLRTLSPTLPLTFIRIKNPRMN